MDCSSAACSFHGQRLPSSSVLSKYNLHSIPKSFCFTLRPASNSRIYRVSTVKSSCSSSNPHPVVLRFRTLAAGAVFLSAATAGFLSGRFSRALAEVPPAKPAEESSVPDANGEVQVEFKAAESKDISPLSVLLESNSNAIEAIRSLLFEKLEEGEDSEALLILRRLMEAQPVEVEWKFLAARLLNEMGQVAEARQLLEEILTADPLSFEALFENAVLMDRCGEGAAAIERLERSLEFARAEHKDAAARDVRLILAQIQFLQKNSESALLIYNELEKEDPKDFRPYFCQGVIYTLLNRDNEAREKFSKYKELSQNKAEVNAYLQTPLSRIKIFGTGDS